MRIISNPTTVNPEDIKAFLESGYKSVDETQVVRIETNKYFDFLMSLITASGASHFNGNSLRMFTYLL